MKKASEKTDYLEFDIPEGLEVPEGVAPGDEFEMVATFEWEEDGGKLCLKAVGGIPVGDDKKEAGEDEDATFAGSVASKFKQMEGY